MCLFYILPHCSYNETLNALFSDLLHSFSILSPSSCTFDSTVFINHTCIKLSCCLVLRPLSVKQKARDRCFFFSFPQLQANRALSINPITPRKQAAMFIYLSLNLILNTSSVICYGFNFGQESLSCNTDFILPSSWVHTFLWQTELKTDAHKKCGEWLGGRGEFVVVFLFFSVGVGEGRVRVTSELILFSFLQWLCLKIKWFPVFYFYLRSRKKPRTTIVIAWKGWDLTAPSSTTAWTATGLKGAQKTEEGNIERKTGPFHVCNM